MRLLTHNFLKSNVRNTPNGYPLKIKPTKIIFDPSPVDEVMVEKIVGKIDYDALKTAYIQIKSFADSGEVEVDFTWPASELPETLPNFVDLPEEIKILLHQVLFDIHILDGKLICPGTNREFTISNGIPNMVLHEDEI